MSILDVSQHVVCVSVRVCVCAHARVPLSIRMSLCVQESCKGYKRACDPQELDLQVVVSHPVDTGNGMNPGPHRVCEL